MALKEVGFILLAIIIAAAFISYSLQFLGNPSDISGTSGFVAREIKRLATSCWKSNSNGIYSNDCNIINVTLSSGTVRKEMIDARQDFDIIMDDEISGNKEVKISYSVVKKAVVIEVI